MITKSEFRDLFLINKCFIYFLVKHISWTLKQYQGAKNSQQIQSTMLQGTQMKVFRHHPFECIVLEKRMSRVRRQRTGAMYLSKFIHTNLYIQCYAPVYVLKASQI